MYDAGSDDKDTSRKDSLSLNVEFVKVNISRSRKGFVPTDISSTAANTSFTTSGGAGKIPNIDSQTAANIVRFSGNICSTLCPKKRPPFYFLNNSVKNYHF